MGGPSRAMSGSSAANNFGRQWLTVAHQDWPPMNTDERGFLVFSSNRRLLAAIGG